MAATGNEAMNLRQARSLFRQVMTKMTNEDNLLQEAVDAKLQPDDLVAGDNVSIDKTSQPGRVVISATVGDAYVLPVATSAALGGVKSGNKVKVLADGTMDVGSGAITADKIADGVIPEIDLATDAEAKGFLGY